MNAKEIASKKFDKSAFGYKTEEVDSYLDDVAAAMNELTAQNMELQNKLEILASKLEEYRQDENSMKEALLGAQKLGNTILKEAKEKAVELLNEAQLKSEEIRKNAVEESQKSLAGIKKDIEKEQHTLLMTQREVSNFKSKLLALYKSHLDTITSIPEIKEKDSEAVESISSKLAENAAEPIAEAAPVAAPETEEAPKAAEPAVASSENEKNGVPPIYQGRFGTRDETRTLESKFGELRFGRNNNVKK